MTDYGVGDLVQVNVSEVDLASGVLTQMALSPGDWDVFISGFISLQADDSESSSYFLELGASQSSIGYTGIKGGDYLELSGLVPVSSLLVVPYAIKTQFQISSEDSPVYVLAQPVVQGISSSTFTGRISARRMR